MKVSRRVLSIVMLAACAAVHGQSTGTPVAGSDAQKSFDLLKTLAGAWQGAVTKPIPLSIRVASHGNALIHELDTGTPEVTVFYVERDRLTLIHYCDFANRPHMVAAPSKNGKTIEFELVDFSGGNNMGHVSYGAFTFIDAGHHLEDWTFLPPQGKPVHAHMDFRRVQ
jgi:hypothetical protein